ncbi:DUF7239 family protein [Mycobacteroides abscessus]|uniref:Uncharacterized protein n=1 Tax=Mycobacteroides abscessus subsp. abscessus TaxID=1185650 RepID=A0AB38CSY4_9MYCO|nr:hypothetical protein [Mycobacteroides abscessus]QST88991.1 hypothetical protein PROPHIGD100A-2_7 [Mycobacterium phage prophi100A-2]QST89740.1 hypothetical protein PROPHIGD43A-3_7 [Mycobacterium phage prophiGD43A-3]QST90461.1 hypothetical protein PROPHIGD33-1_7 [Mycobacterium phage prophiGD33-1]EIV49580.1 hypothetical protein MA3A0930S_4012 [Mycobacteroides abscessus 3A-0930-S]MBN7436055.1 hypothetical protein [Mycobacteroides abscessus subsp. abscessus]
MSEPTRDPREEKLPQWARKLLADERYRASRAEHRLAEHVAKIAKSRIRYGGYDNPIYIPDDNGYQTVYFYPNGGDSTFQQIAVTIRDGAIEIQGGDTLTIELQASNTFRARLRGDS